MNTWFKSYRKILRPFLIVLAATTAIVCLMIGNSRAGVTLPGGVYIFGGGTNTPVSILNNDLHWTSSNDVNAIVSGTNGATLTVLGNASNTLYTTANNASGTVWTAWNNGSNVLATATVNTSNAMVNASNTLYTTWNNGSNTLAIYAHAQAQSANSTNSIATNTTPFSITSLSFTPPLPTITNLGYRMDWQVNLVFQPGVSAPTSGYWSNLFTHYKGYFVQQGGITDSLTNTVWICNVSSNEIINVINDVGTITCIGAYGYVK